MFYSILQNNLVTTYHLQKTLALQISGAEQVQRKKSTKDFSESKGTQNK